MVSKLVPALALILLAGPVMAVAADAPAVLPPRPPMRSPPRMPRSTTRRRRPLRLLLLRPRSNAPDIDLIDEERPASAGLFFVCALVADGLSQPAAGLALLLIVGNQRDQAAVQRQGREFQVEPRPLAVREGDADLRPALGLLAG